jgi:D-glycero-D-manno-heptose 1,7-bisphosphate phosphatase
MRRAIFMDRDGTVTEEVGYVNHVSRLELFPWSAPAVRAINESPFLAVLVTNQAGVARGYFAEDLVGRVHEKLIEELGAGGARLDAIYYCPHHPSAGEPPYRQRCECRKPEPGMLLRAAADLGLDLSASYVIGDKYSDVAMAHRVGARGVMVLTGYGRGEREYQSAAWPRTPDFVAESLLEAVEWILEEAGEGRGADGR